MTVFKYVSRTGCYWSVRTDSPASKQTWLVESALLCWTD